MAQNWATSSLETSGHTGSGRLAFALDRALTLAKKNKRESSLMARDSTGMTTEQECTMRR